jgi:hypothetical protein
LVILPFPIEGRRTKCFFVIWFSTHRTTSRRVGQSTDVKKGLRLQGEALYLANPLFIEQNELPNSMERPKRQNLTLVGELARDIIVTIS